MPTDPLPPETVLGRDGSSDAVGPEASLGVGERLAFLIGPPRAGTTLLQRMLGAHAGIFAPAEPHLVSPLAHLGYYAAVERAPYDAINAAQAIREFVARLPQGERDYLDACRAYTDVLYGRALESSGRTRLLDKTPANALVLPFLTRLYPNARYLVLTRHPLAVLCSYADSFFEGDFEAALAFNDILGRYVPAVAAFLRQGQVPIHHLRYEDLVSAPEEHLRAVFAFLGLEDDPGAVDYGLREQPDGSYGDPKVRHHTRPTTASRDRWFERLAGDEAALAVARRAVDPLDPADLALWGFQKDQLFAPVESAEGKRPRADWRWLTDSYRLRRKVFLFLRKDIRTSRLGKALRRVKYYCDVLLRE